MTERFYLITDKGEGAFVVLETAGRIVAEDYAREFSTGWVVSAREALADPALAGILHNWLSGDDRFARRYFDSGAEQMEVDAIFEDVLGDDNGLSA